MKRLFSMLLICLMLFIVAGCSSTPPDNTVLSNNAAEESTEPPPTEPAPQITVVDYSLTPMANVVDVSFVARDSSNRYYAVDPTQQEPVAIIAHPMCPRCGEEGFVLIEFSSISPELIGQQSFTWSQEITCYNFDHTLNERYYQCAVLFTLNNLG